MSEKDVGNSRSASEEDGSTVLAGSRDAAETWMRRDDQFLREEDREYVLRNEGRSWRSWVSPALFGVLLAVLVGDAVTIGVGAVLGLESAHPVVGHLAAPIAAPVVAHGGLGGLVLLKATAAILLLLLPGVTDSARQTARAGAATVASIGLLFAVTNAWAVLVAAG